MLLCWLYQVETADCIRNMEEISAIPGVDMLFLGQNDLCMSMGLYEKCARAFTCCCVLRAFTCCCALHMLRVLRALHMLLSAAC